MPITHSIRADRLNALPPYLFVEIDKKRRAKIAAGHDVINLGVGDPDRPTPPFIIEAMNEAMRQPWTHQYAPSIGQKELRDAAARFMRNRFGVVVDPDRHVVVCLGSKEGIGHLPLAVVNPGDVVCCPAIGYPVYPAGATFAGAEIHEMPILPENGWKPAVHEIPEDVARRARLLWINYPNNPTAACCDISFFDEVLSFTQRHGIICAADMAYSEIYFDEPPPSIWQTPGATPDSTLAIEFHSLSKTFNMTGWRIAFAVGHPEVVAALAAIKGNLDSGAFAAIQLAAATALDHYDHPDVAGIREVYRERRDVLIPGLREIGCHVEPPAAGFFVWARCPMLPHQPGSGRGVLMDSMDFAGRCLEEANVVVVPGSGFHEDARHWFRIALTVEADRMAEAVDRLKRIDWTT